MLYGAGFIFFFIAAVKLTTPFFIRLKYALFWPLTLYIMFDKSDFD